MPFREFRTTYQSAAGGNVYQELLSANGQLIPVVGAVIPTLAVFMGEKFFKAHVFKARIFFFISMFLTKVDGS